MEHFFVKLLHTSINLKIVHCLKMCDFQILLTSTYLEWGIGIAFIWDICQLPIRYNEDSIYKRKISFWYLKITPMVRISTPFSNSCHFNFTFFAPFLSLLGTYWFSFNRKWTFSMFYWIHYEGRFLIENFGASKMPVSAKRAT